MGAAACVGGAAASSASARTLDLDAISLVAHEAAMRLAIAAAKANPFYPFGAVIIGAADRATLAQGVNDGKINPIFHGEIAAINDYVARHGNQGWADGILYTTGEPCPMCMSAIVWAGLGGVVYGSSISALAEAGIAQIMIDSSAVRDAASFYRGRIMGGILRAETDALFRNRRRSELAKNATRRANRPRSDVMKGEPSPPELINRLARLALSLGGLEQRKMFQRIRGTSDERRRLTDACAP